MTTSNVVVNEKEVLLLLRDFLEENGHYESLIPFERTTGLYPPSLPTELVSLREIILWGNLEELQKHFFESFQNLGDRRELQKCKYAISKQRYLETLVEVNPDKADLLKQQLAEVEKLCPSSEEFKVLLSLLTLPTFAASPEYKDWTIQKGRLQCFYQLAGWISNVLGVNAKLTSPSLLHSPEQRLSNSRLVQLLAKGLLYEQCEGICAHPTSGQAAEQEDSDGGTSKLLDLYNWIKHQPDSAFQLSPSTLQLQVRCNSGSSSIEESNESKGPKRASSESSQPLLTEEATHSQIGSESNHQNSTGDGDQQADVHVAAAIEKEGEKVICKKEGETESKSAAQGDDDGSQQEKDAANLHPKSNMSENSTSKGTGATAKVQLAKLTPNMMKFDDNFVDQGACSVEESLVTDTRKAAHRDIPFLVAKLQSEADLAEQIIKEAALPSSTSAPLLPALLLKETMKVDKFTDNGGTVGETPPHPATKKGRKSSTPKPSSTKQLSQQPPSPSTSPVPHIPEAKAGLRSSMAEEQSVPKAKKHIDFSENLEESIIFPSAKLMAHIKDKQVGIITIHSFSFVATPCC